MRYEITVLAWPDANHPATLADRCTVAADDTAGAAAAYAALFAPPAIHHPGSEPTGHPITECSPATCGREPATPRTERITP